MELIPGPHGPRPTKLIESHANDAAGRFDLAFDQKPHGESRRMPAACRQPAKDCVPRRVFVEMEWLGIKFGGESLDLLLVYPQSPGTEGLPNREVFEIPLTHFALACLNMYRILRRELAMFSERTVVGPFFSSGRSLRDQSRRPEAQGSRYRLP